MPKKTNKTPKFSKDRGVTRASTDVLGMTSAALV